MFHKHFKHNGELTLPKDTWLNYSLFHYYNDVLSPLRLISRDKFLTPTLTTKQHRVLKSLGLTLTFTKDQRPLLLTKHNEQFITVLKDLGFFNLFQTNQSTFGVQLSQVFIFLEYGIKWVRNGFVPFGHLYNIHHMNQDVCDNRTHNLDILPVDIHSFITSLQVGNKNVPTNLYSHDYVLTIFSKASLTTKEGLVVRGNTQWSSRISQLIKSTLVASTAFCVKRMELLQEVVQLTTDAPSDVFSIQALVSELAGVGLMSKVNSFLKGKSIPSLTTIQANVTSWLHSFEDYLLESITKPKSLYCYMAA